MIAADGALPLALTMGEPAGIGGEITLKAWLGRTPAPIFFAIDDPERLARLAAALGLDVPIEVISDPLQSLAVFPRALPVLARPLTARVTPGRPDAANVPAVLAAIETAVELALAGRAGGVVTNPVHKTTLYEAGFGYPGHTEYLGALTAPGVTPEMMLVCPGLKVVPVTTHLALRDAIAALTTERIVACAQTTAAALIDDFGIETPRLAVAALNPHGGEDGSLGSEEIEIIAPAVVEIKKRGRDVAGPFPADTLFHRRARETYDAVICMHHDQALIPLKTIHFQAGIDVTLGLPIVRTSPGHGTALGIAGTGAADEAGLTAALACAWEVAARRRQTGRRRSVA
ncbi:MAG: 4-hydroxythreonine-4-phosphate dehydrogenase PdxA [Proteobacteria bacterium]|nr:4-hydroxythreonine-4-phosphate dehydrogenase PdxA [Pseudomonadota bacterium]